MNSVHSNRGFSLIELLVVVAILGILGAIAVPIYKNYISQGKISSAQAVLSQLPILLENYRAENGQFPADGTYSYQESSTGTVISNSIIDSTGAGLSDFKPRPDSYPTSTGILFDYSLTITSSGTVNEQATYSATGVRDAEGLSASGSYE